MDGQTANANPLLALAGRRYRFKCDPAPVTPTELAKPNVLTYPSYVPGRPIDDVARDMGLDPAGIIKLASNENAFGPSPLALAAMRDIAAAVGMLPGSLYYHFPSKDVLIPTEAETETQRSPI